MGEIALLLRWQACACLTQSRSTHCHTEYLTASPTCCLTCMGVLGMMAAVSALKALQNSIMFSPSGPSAC